MQDLIFYYFSTENNEVVKFDLTKSEYDKNVERYLDL